ncbi:hypothetical protein [Alistipes finegoldii]|uniref:Reverse transcriptase domain-containing protein n=1 Tax=Alistipes finegoldii TaxID=214856 RepID=A0ABQ6S7N1_9BACT|nr:hypothetical protein [Alistipes finegoldii]KAA3160545.1 hypothetical protein F2A26_02060 [Alistipes finegoldii]RYU27285.1 hypothetical protein EAI98_01420 [Alistipes finegoldii]
MNQHDPDSEQALRAIDRFYATQVNICIAALNRMQSAELADKNIILRAIMCDMPDCGICADPTAEDYGVDFWVDRAEYVNDTTFNLYVTQAEENVLWNIEKKGQKPGRLVAPQQRITMRTDGISRPPYIPLIYLTVLSSKLMAMAMSDVLPNVDLSTYYDERVMASLGGERIAGVLDRMTEMQDGEEEAGRPVS